MMVLRRLLYCERIATGKNEEEKRTALLISILPGGKEKKKGKRRKYRMGDSLAL